jgi:hypothetical protein
MLSLPPNGRRFLNPTQPGWIDVRMDLRPEEPLLNRAETLAFQTQCQSIRISYSHGHNIRATPAIALASF